MKCTKLILMRIKQDKTIIHKFDYPSYTSHKILFLKNHDGEFIIYYVYCQEDLDFDLGGCYPFFRRFKIESDENKINIIKEIKVDININSQTNFICI